MPSYAPSPAALAGMLDHYHRYGGGSASAGFTPASIAGLSLWLDGNDAATITQTATKVSQWADKSTNLAHATQATGVNQPVYSATAINSKPGLVFNGTAWLQNLVLAINQPGTVFVVESMTGGSIGVQEHMFDGTANRWAVISSDPSAGALQLYAGNTLSAPINLSATAGVVSAIFNGASSSVFLNGANSATGDAGSQSLAGYYIGQGGGATQEWFGNISEVIVYNSALSTVNRQTVEAYLKTKWSTP